MKSEFCRFALLLLLAFVLPAVSAPSEVDGVNSGHLGIVEAPSDSPENPVESDVLVIEQESEEDSKKKSTCVDRRPSLFRLGHRLPESTFRHGRGTDLDPMLRRRFVVLLI